VDFFTCFTREKTPQNNFSSQNFSVENNYILKRIHQRELGIHMLEQQNAMDGKTFFQAVVVTVGNFSTSSLHSL